MNTHVPWDVAPAPIASHREAIGALYATGHWLFGLSRFADAAAVFRAMVRFAPEDERGWLALGLCHEEIDQVSIALEMFGTGRVFANPAPLCELARARLLKSLGRTDEANEAFDLAFEAAERADDDATTLAVTKERGH
jgi:tetratricopeptide (TPR) repeat protein